MYFFIYKVLIKKEKEKKKHFLKSNNYLINTNIILLIQILQNINFIYIFFYIRNFKNYIILCI